jgi:hypothetical protein
MLQWGMPKEWTADEVRFRYCDAVYHGRGLLTWDQGVGFHLEAFVSPETPPRDQVRLSPGIAPLETYSAIRMVSGKLRIVVPPLPLVDRPDLVQHGRLSIKFPHAYLVSSMMAEGDSNWPARALLQVDSALRLPETLGTRTFIADNLVSMAGSLRGLYQRDGERVIVASLHDGGALELQAGFGNSEGDKSRARGLM